MVLLACLSILALENNVGASEICPPGDVLYLASMSIPDTSLKEVIMEAFLTHGRVRLTFRGLPEKNGEIFKLPEFVRKLRPIVESAARDVKRMGVPAPGKLRVVIDPRPFDFFEVSDVPTFAFCEGNNTRLVIGDVSYSIARSYLEKFPNRKVIYYGPRYDIKEKDMRTELVELTLRIYKEPNLKTIAEKARKRVFTGWTGLPKAEQTTRREVSLSDLIWIARDKLLKNVQLALKEEAPVDSYWKDLFFLSQDDVNRIVEQTVSISANEEIMMVDAKDTSNMKKVLEHLKKNPRSIALIAGSMEQYYWKFPGRVYPLKKEDVQRWGIEGLPAKLYLTKKGKVVIEEGPIKN